MATRTKPTAPTFTEADVLRLAAEAQLSPKTARKALTLGAGSLRAIVDRDRVAFAARRLKLTLPEYIAP